MLAARGIIGEDDRDALLRGLDAVEAELREGTFPFAPDDEDIHMAVERRLTELVGPVGGRLHTGRSRNDQVATDLRLWAKRAAADGAEAVAGLLQALTTAARRHQQAVVPALTHLQPAQPVLWAFQLAAHGFALERDAWRL